MQRISAIFFGVLLAGNAFGQILISGTVSTVYGTPVSEVLIFEKGSSEWVLSDGRGNFKLTANTDSSVLVFQRWGYLKQEILAVAADSVTMDEDPNGDCLYGCITARALNKGGTYLAEDNFSEGNIYDPGQLWQGRMAGLTVYNRAWNPHQESMFRIRGLTSFDPGVTPLIVIDGVPMATLGNLDPQDVGSITILKDGAAAAVYGMRASAGVVLVTTKSRSYQKGLSVSFKTETAAATQIHQQPTLSGDAAVALGANDLGARTNWQEEITRVGLSLNNHVMVSGGTEKSSFQLSTHLRSVSSILDHSGFDQINTRVNIDHREWNDRLNINFYLSHTTRNSDFSFQEAFRFATTFSPTAPVHFPNGDFYQAILFENYNPVALLEMNTSTGKRSLTNYGGKIAFDITKRLTATVRVAQQEVSNSNGQYFSRNSFYWGLGVGGLAERYTDESSFTFAEGFLTYSQSGERFSMSLTGGYSYQRDRSETFSARLSNFPNDELGLYSLRNSGALITGRGAGPRTSLIEVDATSTPDNKIRAWFFQSEFGLGKVLTLSLTAREEGSSKLGKNNKSGLFGAVSVAANVLPLIINTRLKTLNLRIGYGKTGAIPSQSGLSAAKYRYYFFSGGTISEVHGANPDLKWEEKGEWNLGVDVGGKKLAGSVDFYQRRITDLIQEVRVNVNQTPSGNRYENAGALDSRGMELSLYYFPDAWGRFQWTPYLILSSNRTVVSDYRAEKEMQGLPSAPGAGGNTQYIRVAVGEKFGQIWSPVFAGVAANGSSVFQDVNGDGIVQVGSNLAPNHDFTDTGYALPTWELGWGNQLAFRRWKLNFFFRGAFGHSLINETRLLHEPLDLGRANNFNFIRTSKAVNGLTWIQYSSLYVERADFLMLDNLVLEYSVPVKQKKLVRDLRVFVTGQRLFTITNYAGLDPEPILFDRGYFSSASAQQNALAPGIDRPGYYAPARTFMLGLSVGL